MNPRRGTGLVEPAVPKLFRDMRIFHIGVEGPTEEVYFNALQRRRIIAGPRVRIRVCGQSRDPETGKPDGKSNILQVLERALSDDPNQPFREGDERWVVADWDHQSNKPEQWSIVVRDSRQRSVDLAISKPCFEVWITAHAEIGDATASCDELKTRARQLFPGYASSDVAQDWLTRAAIEDAIRRMKNLRTDPSEAVPQTTRSDVDKLLGRLLELAPAH